MARTEPSGSMATPLTPEVPTSRPKRVSGTECSVHDLVGGHRVLALLGLAERGIVDSGRHRVDEAPLNDRPAHGADLVLGVRIEIEAEPLAVRAVAAAAQLERQLQGFHECG